MNAEKSNNMDNEIVSTIDIEMFQYLYSQF